jgi:hypothetical protein
MIFPPLPNNKTFLMSKKVCMFNIENYFQSQIFSHLQQSESDFEVYSTLNNKKLENNFRQKPSVRKILKKSKPKLLKNYLYNSDLIILDLLANEFAQEDVDFVCKTFNRKRKPETYKKIILISSLLTWKETETAHLTNLFKKYNTPDIEKWENEEKEEQGEDNSEENDDEEEETDGEAEDKGDKEVSQRDDQMEELKTPRGENFVREGLKVQTEKKQDLRMSKQLKGVKSEMHMANAKDISKKLTEEGFGFKSTQIKQNENGTNYLLC